MNALITANAARPFRFGYQLRECTADELRPIARDAEGAGFDVLHTFDHVGDHWPPLTPLVVAAEATTTLRLCPLVINNDFHHPVDLAREVAAIDLLSGGRFELGIGAGHSFTEYAQIGVPFDPPAVRKARLRESIEIIRRLLDGEAVEFDGEHYRIEGARVQRSAQARLPILVGVNGKAALAHAAQHADIIGLMMLGRTLEDGQRHEVRWEPSRLDETIAHIGANASGRTTPLELNALVQQVVVTDDRHGAAEDFATRVPGLAVDDALATPFLALGTHDEIAAHLLACRQRWGISYYSVRSIEEFEPVIARLRAADAES